MPFVLRVTDTPPLPQILEIEQIVIVDKTGPSITLGVSSGVSQLVGEFLKGPFGPKEVFSMGEILSFYVGDPNRMDRMSQNGLDPEAVGFAQDGTAAQFDGNGFAELKGKKFRRLGLQRVDTDMTTIDGGATGTKGYLKLTVTVAAGDQTAGKTNKDLVLPAGTRFADDVLTLATVIVALSQDVFIPKGTAVTANAIDISAVAATGPNVFNVLADPTTGVLTVQITATGAPALAVVGSQGITAFFVKGVTAAIALIDTVLDPGLPGYASTISATGISTVNAADAATAVFAAGTAALTSLADKITSQYPAAIKKTEPSGSTPTEDIVHIWSARNWAADRIPTDLIGLNIRAKLWENATVASGSARGRIAIVNGRPATSATSTAADAAKTFVKTLGGGTGAEFTGADADRVSINFPANKIFSTELQKNILVSAGGWKASMFSNLPEEYQSSVANTLIQTIVSMEDAFVANPMTKADYTSLKAAGVSALAKDRAVGWWFYSGVTGVNPTTFPTRVADNRRRFADFVQDTLAQIAAPYNKQPGTTERVDALVGEIEAFLSSLLSASNPSQQRIEAYFIDPKSANTAALTALGIRTIIVKCRMLGDLNDIIFETQIGPTVEIEQAA